MKSHTQRDWLQVRDAADLLGVSEKTLRNWDRSGKLRPARHPINGYRQYRASDLHSLKKDLQPPAFVQQTMDFQDVTSATTGPPVIPTPPTRSSTDPSAMHWRAEVALDPKHRPQLWDRPASTVRRDWRKYPQEAHLLDRNCQNYRRLLPREIAVLQGFEAGLASNDRFSARQIIAALGNAVPPALAEAVVNAVVKPRTWRNYTALEICAGIGGITRAVSKVGFDHLLCVDIDPVCAAFLADLPGLDSAAIETNDLRYTNFGRFKGRIGLLTGGPPCQPWSSGGLRRGSEDDRDVLGEMPQLVADIEPEAFVFENVAGLTTGQNRTYFDRLVSRLQNPAPGLSYGTLAAKFNAADFGVPQIRERVFIVGFRDESAAAVHRCFDRVWASRTHRDPTLADTARRDWVAIGAAIEHLGDPGGWRPWFAGTGGVDKEWDEDDR